MTSLKDLRNCTQGICSCNVGMADRGWFERFHNYCKDKENENESRDGCRPENDAYQFIMSIAIVCGLAWIVAGGLSFKAYSVMSMSEVYTLGSLVIYIIGYIIFAGLFGVTMAQINYRNLKLTKAGYCGNLEKKFKRSGNEFMSYSICGFILIIISILCTLYSLRHM